MATLKRNAKANSPLLGFYLSEEFGHIRFFVRDQNYLNYLLKKLQLNHVAIVDVESGSVFFEKISKSANTPERKQKLTEELDGITNSQVLKVNKKDLGILTKIIANYNEGLGCLDYDTRDWLTGAAKTYSNYRKEIEDYYGMRAYIQETDKTPRGLSEMEHLQIRRRIKDSSVAMAINVANYDFQKDHNTPFKGMTNDQIRKALTQSGEVSPDSINGSGNTLLMMALIYYFVRDGRKQEIDLFLEKKATPTYENKYGLSALDIAALDPNLFELFINSKMVQESILPEHRRLTREDCLEKCWNILKHCIENQLHITPLSENPMNIDITEKLFNMCNELRPKRPALAA